MLIHKRGHRLLLRLPLKPEQNRLHTIILWSISMLLLQAIPFLLSAPVHMAWFFLLLLNNLLSESSRFYYALLAFWLGWTFSHHVKRLRSHLHWLHFDLNYLLFIFWWQWRNHRGDHFEITSYQKNLRGRWCWIIWLFLIVLKPLLLHLLLFF